ncbi:ornithine carbamoyltransferase [Variovorax ginsengisoli]|uniref:Ornithine carbamoyltransferase n=1 Tax=Variovorax ginsengisoli TaxID=363844 RepID=A0ABT9S749_9BURK|nr:ornithine carbamoyltransferase [Variovorax ginsengisoli]MDP9899703.1 ornithine carbamoyltransferase [Variovorax ginsengisoli]
MSLVSLSALSSEDVRAIWHLVEAPGVDVQGTVAWSFEGNGIRTRTTFLKAFQELNLSVIELPNLLKTGERVCDLAGYLDPFYDIYVVRESNHERIAEFAASSRRPVVNAMSSAGHPCEVLTDAYFIETVIGPIRKVRICLWGPPTNVFRSWHELADVMDFSLVHICHESFHTGTSNVIFSSSPLGTADVVITDGWPRGTEQLNNPLSVEDLNRMGQPVLLPTPPFAVGGELSVDPRRYPRFAGYEQKKLLLPVQKAVLQHLLTI